MAATTEYREMLNLQSYDLKILSFTREWTHMVKNNVKIGWEKKNTQKARWYAYAPRESTMIGSCVSRDIRRMFEWQIIDVVYDI